MGRIRPEAVMGVIRTAEPVFRNSTDKVAFAVHASFMASGFALHATAASASSSSSSKGDIDPNSAVEVGIDNWNEEEGRYSFVYFYPNISTIKIFVEIVSDSEEGNLHIRARKENRATQLQIEISRFVPPREETTRDYWNLHELTDLLEKEMINAYNCTNPHWWQ